MKEQVEGLLRNSVIWTWHRCGTHELTAAVVAAQDQSSKQCIMEQKDGCERGLASQ